MRKITSEFSFRLWIGLARRVIVAVDELRYGSPSQPSPRAQQRRIAANDRVLSAIFYPTSTSKQAAVLLFHGIGDRVAYWANAQQYLAQQGFPSLIFHYSGYGDSTGATTPDNLHADAHAAYAELRSLVPPGTPIFLLGFSLGTGLAAEVARSLTPPPAGLILAQPFSSLRDAAGEVVRPFRPLRLLLPDLWRTEETLATPPCPLLVVHSDADELFPTTMGQRIHQRAAQSGAHPVHIAHPVGFRHNAIYLQVPRPYWQPILNFIARYAASPNLD